MTATPAFAVRQADETGAPKLWVDVEDLFEYASGNARPSGIQRLTLELYAALQEGYGASGLLFFVRHDPQRDSYRTVGWAEIAALFSILVSRPEAAPPPIRTDGVQPRSPLRRAARKLAYRIPADLRSAGILAAHRQSASLRAWRALVVTLARSAAAAARSAARSARHRPGPPETFEALSAPGDILLLLGAFWSHPDYAGRVAALKRRQIRFITMVYDLIPLLHPEWCDIGLVRLFRSSFSSVVPHADHVFTISHSTSADLAAYVRKHAIPLSAPVTTIPIGTGFTAGAHPKAARPMRNGRHPALPREFVLVVATIEVRKNHLLLFRLWQRLIDDLPPDQVPTLVFAGRVGWMVSDLMGMITNTDHLGGKLLIVENPTDADLAALYAGCMFTIFPSWFEGWGLPVTESLSFGKPCLIANRTSLPEAGAGLCRMFDPDDAHDAYAALRTVLDDRALLAAWQHDVAAKFRPVPWSVTAHALLAGLGHPLAHPVAHTPARHALGPAPM